MDPGLAFPLVAAIFCLCSFLSQLTDSAPISPSCPSPLPIPRFTSKPQTPPHHGSGHGVYQTFVGQHRGHGATLFTQTPQSVWVRERTVSSPTSQKSGPPPPERLLPGHRLPSFAGESCREASVKYPETFLNTDWPGSMKGRDNAKQTRKAVFRAPPACAGS